MDARLNRIIAWLDDPSGDVTEDIRILDAYYRSPLWRSDFEADEAGKLPADLPRGVLSEDGIYNALQAYDDRQSTLSQCEEPRTETQKSVKDNKESGHMSCQAADF